MFRNGGYKQANLALVIITFILGVWAYGKLPEEVASHWNASGEADGYYSKLWGTFLFPAMTAFVYFIYLLIPKIAIKKESLESFRNNFDRFFSALFAFLIYMFAMTLWWNINGEFNFNRFLSVGFAFLVWEASVLIGSAKRNWFVGVRTPWTLSSEKVWNETHKLAARLFRYATFITLLGAVWPQYFVWLVLVSVLTASLIPVVYSYFKYKEIKK